MVVNSQYLTAGFLLYIIENMKTTRLVLTAILALFVITPAFSYNKNDLMRAVESDSSANVKKILSRNPNLATVSFNSDKDSILMVAIDNDCSVNVIEDILKAGCSPDIKNAYGQTALMYACKKQAEPRVIRKIINFNVLTKGGKEKRCTVADKDGKTAFDYAGENSSAYNVLLEFAQDPKKVPPKEKKSKKTQEEEPLEETEEVAEEVADETEEVTEEVEEVEETAEEIPEEAEEVEEVADEPVEEVEEIEEERVAYDEPEELAEETIEETADESFEEAIEAAAVAAAAVPVIVEETEPEEETEEAESEEESEENYSEEYDYEETEEYAETYTEETEETPEEVPAKIDVNVTQEFPKIDHYSKNNPEYLFDDMDAETTVVTDDYKPITISNPDATDRSGRTRLMNAIMSNDVELCYNLLYSGAKITSRDKDGWTPLMYACRYAKSPDIVVMLFNHGSTLTEKANIYGITPLSIAAAYCQNEQILNIVLEHAKIEKIEIAPAFVTALTSERPAKIVKEFLPYIKNINKLISGKTPLMYAAQNYSDTSVIKLLLESGADPYIISSEKKNAFSYAKENNRIVHDSVYWSLNVSYTKKR